MNFTFRTVPNVIFEAGASSKLGALVASRMKRPVIVTDKGIIAAGLINAALQSLKDAGLDFLLFDGIEADPPARVVRNSVEIARAHKADGVIGFGGGSSMDTAKIIAVLLNSAQSLEEIYGTGNIKGGRSALALLPTTSGTGSEVTDIAVVTSDDDQKIGILGDQMFADIAILDPELTYGLPRHVTAATGVDAMVHAIEAYTNCHKKNPVSDALAREALRLLAANIVEACETPSNKSARANMLLGAMLAGQAFTNSPVGAVHGMAYPLGALFHIPHGASNALMLEPVLRFNASAAAPLYAELGDVIGANATGGFAERCDAFTDRLMEIVAATGVERRLSNLGISHNDLPRMAEDAMKAQRVMQNNPRDVTYEDALKMYGEVL
ncbi:MAG: alcohol dehydrogenase [Alphaproteobacteria bacterium RIFCSPHIGHO2_12_FULL_63_12]|nr:MAG: alcohol dehydrogenase [Alphaproteobacteria bacterium RIFCSPHIGHO2_12_FULL_63_12]